MKKSLLFLRQHSCGNLFFTSRYQMPKIKPYNGEIPSELISFHRLCATKHDVDAGAHFYIYDRHFECLWNNPERYLGVLRRCTCVISPDYSAYTEMLLPQVLWNSYRNKMMAAWMQANGINVICNVSWSRPWSYDFCFEGIPHNTVIAINSTGIGKDGYAKSLWKQGYDAALSALNPTLILRYGAKQAGEREDISVYYPNDNFKAANYGRKRV